MAAILASDGNARPTRQYKGIAPKARLVYSRYSMATASAPTAA